MNLQHERLTHLCTELRLSGVMADYPAAAEQAAKTSASFIDFLETVLRGELDTRRARSRTMLSRVAGFPAVKTLDQFDFEFAVGAPRTQIQQLAGLGFIGGRFGAVAGYGATPRQIERGFAPGGVDVSAVDHRRNWLPAAVTRPSQPVVPGGG